MKFGFKLLLHKSIPPEDRNEVLEFLRAKLKHFSSENSYKVGYACSHSYYRRGIFGLSLKNTKYTFKRLVKNRRIFGVVPTSILERIDGEPLEINQCVCAEHRGGQRVRLKRGFVESDFECFAQVGEIKG